jgi:putative DNA primase/helicase
MIAPATPANPIVRLLDLLSDVKREGGKGHQWNARCPAHDDERASLSVGSEDGWTALVKCQAGCATEDVLSAVGLTMADLFPPRPESVNGKRRIVATYDYHDADGRLVFQVVRFEPKDFRQRRPDGNGGWVWSVKGCPVLPYRLPAIHTATQDKCVYTCEGEKDCDRLASADLTATCNAGGAGKWKKQHAEYLVGLHVAIFADNDDPGRKHAEQVARSLAGKAASIKVVELPDLPPKGDVSDWLDAGHTVDELRAIVAATAEWEAGQADAADAVEAEPVDDPGIIQILADLICESDHFAQDLGGQLFRYSGGAYRSRGETFIKAEVKRLCLALGNSKAWSTKLANEVVEWIRVDAPELWERPPIDVVNCQNGLLRLTNGELLSHTPDHLSPIQIPVTFDPEATCPAIDQFVRDVFPPDAIDLAYEIPGSIMAPNVSIQKAVLLLGSGGNGKSTYLTLVTMFVGKTNCTGLSLHKLESNRFSIARLVGKLANVCPDLPSEHLSGTSVFKALTGSDVAMEAEVKFHGGFSFDPYCRLVFSANHPPRSSDASDGFFERWHVVPFDAKFRGTKVEIPRHELDQRLSAPSELSGLLNQAVTAWQRVQARGCRLAEPESIKQAWQEFHATTDPLAVWLDQFTIDDPDAVSPIGPLRAAYGAACERAGRPSPSEKQFGHAIRRARPTIQRKQRTVNGRYQWCYVGIGLRDDDPFTTPHTPDAPDNAYLLLTHARKKEDTSEEETQNNRELETSKAHPVHPVHPVDKNCDHEWADDPPLDGRIRTACRLCRKFNGYRPVGAD